MTQTIQVFQPDGETFIGTIESGSKVSIDGGPPEDRFVVVKEDGSKAYVFPSRSRIQVVDAAALQAQAAAAQAQVTQVTAPATAPGLAHLAPTPGVAVTGGPPPPPAWIEATHAIGGPDPTPVAMHLPGAPGADAPISFRNSAPPPGSSRGGSQLVEPLPAPVDAGAAYIPPPAPMPAAPPPRAARPRPERFMVMPKSGKPKVFHTREDCGRVSPEAKRLPVDEEAIEFWELVLCQPCQRRDEQMSFPEAMVDALAEYGIVLPQAISGQVFDKLKGYGFNVTPQAVDR